MFPPLIAERDGSGIMTIALLGALPMVPPGAIVHVELHRDDYKLHQHVPFAGSAQTVTIENIAAGPWDVKVMLLDTAGVPTHEGTGNVHVHEQSTAYVNIALQPRPGQLAVTITLGERCTYVRGTQCLADLANAGRLYIHPGAQEGTDRHDFSWTPSQTESTVQPVTLPLGSYDFQIIFYEGSRIASNQVFQSFWIPFDILPGRTTTAVWHPEIGALDVDIDVEGPPPPPRSLTATVSDVGVTLTWDPPSDTMDGHAEGAVQGYSADAVIGYNLVGGYNVYGRQTRQEAFRLLAHVEAQTTEWRHTDHPACADEGAQPFYYVVTAVNDTDYESLRSDEVSVCRP